MLVVYNMFYLPQDPEALRAHFLGFFHRKVARHVDAGIFAKLSPEIEIADARRKLCRHKTQGLEPLGSCQQCGISHRVQAVWDICFAL